MADSPQGYSPGLDPRTFRREDPTRAQNLVVEYGSKPLWSLDNPAASMLRQTDQVLSRFVPGLRR